MEEGGGREVRSRMERAAFSGLPAGSQFILAIRIEEAVGAVIVGDGHEHMGQAIQVFVVGQGGIDEFMSGGDAVFFEHDDEHLHIDEGAGVEKFAGRVGGHQGMVTGVEGFLTDLF